MNTTFDWAKALGYGALIWLLMFALISALVGYQVQDNLWSQALTVAISAILGFAFAFGVQPKDGMQALSYGFVWALVGIVLDRAISYQFNNAIFSMWSYWIGYAMVVLAPLATVTFQPSQRHSPG